MHFVEWNFCIFQIALKCVLVGPIDGNSSLVVVMALCEIGNKPLPETTVTRVTHIPMVCDIMSLGHNELKHNIIYLLCMSNNNDDIIIK